MIKAKQLLIILLAHACTVLDRCGGMYVCRKSCRLATWSDQLDQRWRTGVWTVVSEESGV